MLNLISLLPDELWISILHDWIGTPLALCALDIALCNRSLRKSYLSWLERFGLTTKLSNISFVNFDKNLTKRGIYMKFFDWCKKRKVFPSSFSYSYALTVVPEIVLDVMKHVERLKAYCENRDNVEVFANILNDCPQLKHLMINVIHNHRFVRNNILSFEGFYPLISLELHDASFWYFNGKFHEFIRACPMLEDIKLWNCEGIELNHVKYLLRQCKHLTSLYVAFTHTNGIEVLDVSDNGEDGNDDVNVNMCMKSLILKNFNTVLVSGRSTMLLSVLTICPALESLMLSGDDWDEILDDEEIVHWCDMIATCWQHLKSLTLHDCSWLTTMLIMEAIGCCCNASLKNLSFHQSVSNDLIALICKTFTALESLELRDPYGSLSVTYDTLVQQFIFPARFVRSLQSLSLLSGFTSRNVMDYSNLLSVFPVLRKLEIMVFNSHAQIISLFPTMQQIKELTLFTPLGVIIESMDGGRMLNGFVNVQTLSLSRFALTKVLMQSILSLPQLQVLLLRDVCSDNNELDGDIFHMEQYALSCALKELQIIKIYRFSTSILFTEKMLRSILTSFVSSLQSLTVHNANMSKDVLRILQQEYRFKTNIACEVEGSII